jgi:site-specific DNA-methyltransferase (adenine-specific)
VSFAVNEIVLGDCVDVMRSMPDECVDFVLTDPPYLVNYRDRTGRTLLNDVRDDWLQPAFIELARVMKRNTCCVSFYGWSAVDRFFAAWRAAGLRPVGHLTFPKRYSSSVRMLRYQHEGAYLLAKGSPSAPASPIGDVIDWSYSGNKLHPTQKPLSVLVPLIQSFCPPGGLVFDPFAGSGSTCVAARALHRRFLGCELDAQMHEVASRRVAGQGLQLEAA